ncbi:hypothetical protein [Glaciihabitans sp. dw_435]|uniref:hypothetical protein n=1 Tax=Glaciihabitans sp. dw_435 TaxID=2720081 RepID=UPI001BD582F1|nr:hypothetical protein [Glaciihabitans sp. dw_435]
MNTPEQTQQQVDPASAMGARVPAITLAVIPVIWAGIATIIETVGQGPRLPELLALLSFVIAAAIVARQTAPERAPFTATTHVVVLVFGLAAFFFDTYGGWGSQDYLRDDWAPACIGLLILAMSSYRPPRELVILGSVAAVIIGVSTLVELSGQQTVAPVYASALTVTLPLIACAYGAARYSRGIVLAFSNWHLQMTGRAEAHADERRDEINRAVHQDRIALLSSDVTPFLSGLLSQNAITDDDRATARSIAGQIRTALVASVDRTWLQTSVAALRTVDAHPHEIHDNGQLAPAMSHDQRTAVRALLFALGQEATPHSVSISIEREGISAVMTLLVQVDASSRTFRGDYNPYLAVARNTFPILTVSFTPPTLLVRFSYDAG